MKKITLLLLLSFSYSLTFGQIVLSEDFEPDLSLPTGWTNNEITSIGNIWTFETGGFAKYLGDGNTSFYSQAGFSGNYTIFDSDGYGGGPEEAALESPVFDCSGLTNIKLTYNHLFVSGFGGEAYVEVYDGSTWVEVVSYSEPGVAVNTFIAGNVIIDVTAQLAGVSNAQVRFRWIGNNSYYWGLDDISVQQPTTPAPDAVTNPNPISGATDVAIDISGATPLVTPFEWIAATTGEPATSFDLNLGTNPAGDNIGTISGFDSGDGVTFNWQYNTLYYWYIDAVNIGGSTSSQVWSFTTEADPSLSNDEFEQQLFNIYPNPASSMINIKSNLVLSSIDIFNQLGQRVIYLKSDQLISNSIDINGLAKGMYLMTVKADDKQQTIKFIKE